MTVVEKIVGGRERGFHDLRGAKIRKIKKKNLSQKYQITKEY